MTDLAKSAPDTLVRFTVQGRAADKALVRDLAKRLAAGGPAAAALRDALDRAKAAEPPAEDFSGVGGVLRWLRASPLVGADLDLSRDHVEPRSVDFD